MLRSGEVLMYQPDDPKPYDTAALTGLKEFLTELCGRDEISQLKLEAVLGKVPSPPAVGDPACSFVSSGPYAMGGAEDFRDIENFNIQAVVKGDAAAFLTADKKDQPGWTLPAPRWLAPRPTREERPPKWPSYLGMAHGRTLPPGAGAVRSLVGRDGEERLMARTRAEPITSVTVPYDLYDLPTAQHKAGLAGLILQIRSMEERAKKGGPPLPEAVPTIDEVTTTSATVTFTEKTVQGLFDDLYDAKIAEVAVKSKWPKQTPKRVEEVEETDDRGKKTTSKRFIYDVTQPCGHFLRQYLPDGEGLWLKLWRECSGLSRAAIRKAGFLLRNAPKGSLVRRGGSPGRNC